MSALHGTFEVRPEAVQRVGMNVAAYVFLLGVVDCAMGIADAAQCLVGLPFVAADLRALRNVPFDQREQRGAARVRDNARNNIAAALDHPEDGRLETRRMPVLSGRPSAIAANVGLVDFDMAAEPVVAVNLRHVLANLVAHAPRGLVRHSELALEFLGGDAVLRRREQVDRVEPHLERRARILEGRPGARIDVIPTILAGVSRTLFDPIEQRILAALRAFQAITVSNAKYVLQACRFVRVFLEKVYDCQSLSHFFLQCEGIMA